MKWRYKLLIGGAVLGVGVVAGVVYGLPPVVVWQAQRALAAAGYTEASIAGLHLGLSGATVARFDLTPRVHASAVTVEWHLGGLFAGHVDRVTVGEVQVNAQWTQGRLDVGRRDPEAPAQAGAEATAVQAPPPFDHLTIGHAVVVVAGDGWKLEGSGQATADTTSDGRLALAVGATLPGVTLHADGTVDPHRLTGDGVWHGEGDIGEIARWLPPVALAVAPEAGLAPVAAPAAGGDGSHPPPGSLRWAGRTLGALHGVCTVDGTLRQGGDGGGIDATINAHDLGVTLALPALAGLPGRPGEPVDVGCSGLAGACDVGWGAGAVAPRVDLRATDAAVSAAGWGIRIACPQVHAGLAGGMVHGDARAEVLGAGATVTGERDADGAWRGSLGLTGIDLAAWQARVRPWLDLPLTMSGTAKVQVEASGGADGACAATGDIAINALALQAPFGTAVLSFNAPTVTGNGQAHRGADGALTALVVPHFATGRIEIPAYHLVVPDLAATVPYALGGDPELAGDWHSGPWSVLGHDLPAAHGTLAVVGHGLVANAVTDYAGLSLRGAVAMPGDGTIHADAAVDPGMLGDLHALLPLIPQLAGWEGGGRVSAAASADFTGGQWHPHVEAAIAGGHLARADQNLDITGINAAATLTSLSPVSARIISLHVAHVALGPQAFDHIVASANLVYPAVDLTDAGWAWADGRFTAAAMHADLDARVATGTVAVDHLDLARLVELFAKDRVSASGRLAGSLPLAIHWDPLVVAFGGGGALTGDSGQVRIIDPALLAQVAEPVVANLSKSADNLGPAQESMRQQVRKTVYDGFADFIYTSLGVTVTPKAGGGNLTSIVIAGRGENGLPIRCLTFNISGLEDGINSALALHGMPVPTAPTTSQADIDSVFGP